MITVEPISHYAATLIYRQCWDHVAEDGLDRDTWEAGKGPNFLHIGAFDDGRLVGVTTCEYVTSVCVDSHAAYLPCAYRGVSQEAGELTKAYIWHNTAVCTIMARTPAYNRLTVAYLKRHGFKQVGIIPRCWRHNGELHDTVISCITRGDECPQP